MAECKVCGASVDEGQEYCAACAPSDDAATTDAPAEDAGEVTEDAPAEDAGDDADDAGDDAEEAPAEDAGDDTDTE